ncbi:hypothetical protein AYO44_11500 [Planctomycetaceae bacterium SCGC AG-212-F19]|nr:hypothetical protein AYO44_11500 [Planctomycetaceae bacterium SCGC AG-212-F19]
MEPTRVLVRLSDRKIRNLLAPALPIPVESTPVPDPLIRATVRAATRVVQGEVASAEMMSAGASGLVDDAIRALAYGRWRLASS